MKLSIKEKLGYSIGEFAGSGLWQTMVFFVPIFYTDVYMLPAGAAATLFLVVKFFDALNDPVMGTIAGRTRSRWGRFRPYLLFGAVPLGIVTVLMFTSQDFSDGGKLAYAYVTHAHQSAESLLAIRFCMTILPAGVAVIGIIVMYFYNLKDSKLLEIEIELNTRRGKQASHE